MSTLLLRNSNKRSVNITKDEDEHNSIEYDALLNKKTSTNYYYFVFLLLTLLSSFLLVNNSINTKDYEPLSDIYNNSEFNATRAQVHLNTISSLPHSFNNLNNSKTFEYLLDQVKLLKNIGGDKIEYILDVDKELVIPQYKKQLNNWLGSFATYFPTSNLIVKLKGSNSNGKALLLSAHYDSRPLSPGATDAGVAVAASLEILKTLLNRPQEGFDLIVNFNNAEETFLLGARSYKFSKWFNDTKYFINLEGSGAGGKPLLFQSSNYELTKALVSGDYHHVNAIGNDLFNLRLLPSATDYQVYTKDLNLTGVDLAMYRNRAFYHTIKDDLKHAPISTTNYMGAFTLQGIRNLKTVSEDNQFDKVVYFDILSLSSVVWDLSTCHKLIGLFYILELILVIIYFLKFNNLSILTGNLKSVAMGCLTNFMGFVLNLVLGILLIHQLIKFNPMVVHTWPRLIFIIFLLTSIWSQLLSHTIWLKYEFSKSTIELNSWLGTLALFNILVALQLIAHIYEFVSLFFIIIQAYSILIGFTIYLYYNQYLIYPKSPKLHQKSKFKANYQPYWSLLVTYLPSSVIIMGVGFPLLLAGHQGPPTGASPYLPYLICLITTGFSSLLLGPTLIPIVNLKKFNLILVAPLVLAYLLSLTLFPYSETSPLPIDYDQIIQLNKDYKVENTFVQLRMSSKSDKLINDIKLKPIEILTGVKGGKSTFDIIKISASLPELPNYKGFGVNLLNSSKIETEITEAEIEFKVPESKICYLAFVGTVDNLEISHATTTYIPMTDSTVTSSLTDQIRLFRNDVNKPWNLKFQTNSKEIIIKSKCYLERREQVNELLERLPNWSTLTNQKLGIVEVQIDFPIKL